jgi:hypothetical protein
VLSRLRGPAIAALVIALAGPFSSSRAAPPPAAILPPAQGGGAALDIDAMNEYMVSRINMGRDNSFSGENPSGEQDGLSWHGCLKRESPASCSTEGTGLWGAATTHTQSMIAAGALNPVVTSAEVGAADPDPPELNFAPDDGFGPPPFVYCANVARTSPIPLGFYPNADIVEKTYQAWRDPANTDGTLEIVTGTNNRECMFDEAHHGYTVGGAGFVQENLPDGLRYRAWVTLIVVVDETIPPFHQIYPVCPPYCPGSTPTPIPTATPTHSPTPTPSPTPSPTPTPTASPVPTASPTPSPTRVPTPSPTPSPTPVPTPTPRPTVTPPPPCNLPQEEIVQIGSLYVASNGLYQESNAHQGLQRRAYVCPDGTPVPPDTKIVGIP